MGMNVETFITICGLLKNYFFDITFILCRHSLYISQASFFYNREFSRDYSFILIDLLIRFGVTCSVCKF